MLTLYRIALEWKMPPRLHPRSTFTSSIFVTTLAASFLVVGLPHILPCPAPRVAFADEEVMIGENGRRMRRRRKCVSTDPDAPPGRPTNTTAATSIAEYSKVEVSEDEAGSLRDLKAQRMRRECPLPKPGGKVGELLGFKARQAEMEKERNPSRPP